MSNKYRPVDMLKAELHPRSDDSHHLRITPNMFRSKDASQLPSYKDKTYTHSSTTSTKIIRPMYRRRRVLIVLIVVIVLMFWIMSTTRTKHLARNNQDGLANSIRSHESLKGNRPKLMREGGRALIEQPDSLNQKLGARVQDSVNEQPEEIEMEMVSGGEVPKGKRPKLMREGGRAWIQMPDGTKQELGKKKAL
jgi:hypothetical protein